MRRLLMTAALAVALQVQAEDITDIFHLAVENDPTYLASEANLRATAQSVPQALARFLPALRGTISTTGTDSGIPLQGSFNTKSYNLSLTQPIYRMDIWSAMNQSTHVEQQGIFNYLLSFQDLMIRVSEQYFNVLSAEDDYYFASSQRKAFARQLEQTQQRFEVGLIAITDVHEAQARYDGAIATETQARNNVSDQYEILREIVKSPIGKLAFLKGANGLPLVPPDPNVQENWVMTAQRENLGVKVASEASKVAKAEISNQASGHFPQVDVQASVGRSNSAPPFNQLTMQKTASLNVSIPIFEGGGVTFRTKEARARYDESLKRLELQRRTADSTTRQRFRGVLTQIKQVQSFAQTVISTQSALKATQAAYEVGTRTIVDVLDAETRLFQAQRDYHRARYNYILEGLRLKRAAGILKPEDLYAVNHFLITDENQRYELLLEEENRYS